MSNFENARTLEEYVEAVLAANPDFVAEIDARVLSEYGQQISETQRICQERIDAAMANWTANRGAEYVAEHEAEIKDGVLARIPRFCYIKHVELSGDTFEVELDTLTGKWSIAPV